MAKRKRARPCHTVDVVDLVERIQEAASHARSWTEPASCGLDEMMPCQHPRCIERAGHYTADWARQAFHWAGMLQRWIEGKPIAVTPTEAR